MSTRRKRPAFAKARAYVLDLLRRETPPGSDKTLPPIRELAQAADVSYAVMWKAVDSLRSEGVLSGGAGCRLAPGTKAPGETAGSGESPAAQPPRRKRHWEQICFSLRTAVAGGAYTLPHATSTKELMGSYRASYHTIRKAVDELVDLGLMVRRGKSVHACPLAPTTLQNVIGLAAVDTQPTRSPLFTRVLHSLETACAQRDLRLVRIPIRFDGKQLDLPALRKQTEPLADGGQALGYVIWRGGLGGDRLWDVAGAMHCHEVPAVVMDGSGGPVPKGLSSSWPSLRFVRVAQGAHPGAAMGRHLLEMGHQNIVWFSPAGDSEWSRNRLAGLREVFASWGYPDGVTEIHAEPTAALRTSNGEGSVSPGQAIGSLLAELASSPDEPHRFVGRVLRSFRYQVAERARAWADYEAIAPLLREVLNDGRATAWVGANDPTAIHCLQFAEQSGVEVGRDLAVAGFDDTPEASVVGLTSYNFGALGHMNAALNHILWSSRGRARPRDEMDTTRGYVSVRRSTAPGATPASGVSQT